jgi:protein TonB
MQRVLLLSSGLHALALAAMFGLRAPALPDPEQPARIEMVFGPAAAPTPAAWPVLDPPLPDPPAPGPGPMASPTQAPPATSPTTDPGVRPERPDPTLIPAQGVASNRGPDYPPSAWQQRQQGTVLLRLHIGADGAVIRVETRRSSGVPALDAAAIAALSVWRFLPAERAGQPVASYRDQPVSFVLE